MRILLIKPSWQTAATGLQIRYAQAVKFPALGLGILAALSEGHEVDVADAGWEPIPFGKRYDLVGITVTTFASQQVYEIASSFRRSGALVVLGGVHASIMSDECLQHVDAVVIGEAEYTWPQVLRDAEHGNLKTVYRAPHPTDMKHVPMARRDVLRESSWFTAVEATRGCPNRCSYCYLPSVPWHIHRKRPVELVLEEIRGLPQKSFIFVDENLFADRVYARQLFRAIKPFNKFWLVQAPTNLVDDDETLDAMAEGGCFNVQVGFQSFNRKSLQEGQVNHHRLDRYRDLVQALHQRRIVVSGFFVFGFDSDGLDVFPDTVEAIREIGVDDANMFVLTPFPGTALYVQLAQEGRLLPSAMDREQFVWSKAVYQPRKMTAEELEKGVQWAYDSLHSHFRKKLFKVLMNQFDRLLVNPRFALGIVRGNLRHNKIG